MIRKLCYYGDPVLRKHATPIAEITEEIKQLALDLIETMHAYNGVGIAAPQIGISLRIFISALEDRDRGGYDVFGKPEVYINPKVISFSKEELIYPEGCISIPGIYEDISRPSKITVEALDIEGKPFIKEAKGWKARNILHENDHINGVLIIDRVSKLRRQQLEPALKRIKKKYASK